MLRTLSRHLSRAELAPKKPSPAEEAAKVIRAEALPAVAFELGVANVIVLAWLFGAHPEHYWVAWFVEFPVIFGLVARVWYKAGRLLYFAEFCWVVTSLGWVYLAAELLSFAGVAHPLAPAARLGLARTFFSVSNGPLALSVLALSNSLVFHDIERWGSVVIHFGPALTSWAIRWKRAELQAAWPGAFGTSALAVDVDAAGSAACRALRGAAREACAAAELAELNAYTAPIALYGAWWVVYAGWLLAIGCVLPERHGWRSSFADMRPICAAVGARAGVPRSAVRAHAALYLVMHGALVTSALSLLPRLLYGSARLHAAFIVLLVGAAVRQGAAYYRNAWGERLAKAVARRLERKAE